MSGVLGGPGGAGVAVGGASSELLTVTVVRDEHGYGMKVSGDNPVYVQSVKSNGAAWRAGLRAGDRIVCVNQIPVPTHTHVQVVDMIRGSPTALLTVQQTTQKRQSSSITAPVPVDREKQRQLEFTKIHTIMLMLDNEKRHMETLKKELSRGSDARKQEELDSAEQRCIKLQHQIDIISQPLHPAQQDSALSASQPQLSPQSPQPQTPRLSSVRTHRVNSGSGVATSTGFLSGLPRSLSNLTGQSLRNLRQARQNMMMSGGKSQTPDMNSPNLERQLSENGEMSSGNVKRTRHGHNNTVPMVPVTCLDGLGPPPLPPRSTERLMKPKRISNPGISSKISSPPSFHGSMGSSYPSGQEGYGIRSPYTRSARSLDVSAETTDGRQTDESGIPNSIAMQMSYPLVAVTHPPIQSGNLGLTAHSRSQSSPEHLDTSSKNISEDKGHWECGMSPPGTPPPPYPCAPPIPPPNTQPCADPQRAIISMEEDESPTSDSSGGLFSSLRNVLESKAKSAVLLNWLLGERRSSNAHLLLLVTEAYRRGGGVGGGGGAGGAGVLATRRWAYEIHSTFVMPGAVLALNNPDENLAREVDEILQNEYDKEEILRNVFRKARSKAKEELTQQLSDFQVKRHLGLGELYSPPDHILEKCDTDKSQESAVVESLLRSRLSSLGAEARGDTWGCTHGSPAAAPAAAALAAAAHHELGVRTSMIAEAFGTGGGNRAAFLQRDKHYKQRLKQISKQTAQPFVVRGHHLSLQAMLSVAHCHHCHIVVWGLAPQAYVCGDCQLTVHRSCARSVEEACCGPSDEHQPRRISRLMDKIHATAHQDGQDRKSRKTSSTSNFLNMERNARKQEDDAAWDTSNHNTSQERRHDSEESIYESAENGDSRSTSDEALARLAAATAAEAPEVRKTQTKPQGHRKTMSLSNPIELVKSMGDEWLEMAKRELEEHSKRKGLQRKKSKDSSNEDLKLDIVSEKDVEDENNQTIVFRKPENTQVKVDKSIKKSKEVKPSKKETCKLVEDSKATAKKIAKASSVHALSFMRKKRAPTCAIKAIEAVTEIVDKNLFDQTVANTHFFLEAEKHHSSDLSSHETTPEKDSTDYSEAIKSEDTATEVVEYTSSEAENPTPQIDKEIRPRLGRRLSRTNSRSKSKIRGKSQGVRINTLRKSQSGTLKRAKKKKLITPSTGRSRHPSIVDPIAPVEDLIAAGAIPKAKKKSTSSIKSQNNWFFGGSFKGENRREGSDESSAVTADGDADTSHEADKENADKDVPKHETQGLWRSGGWGGKPVARAESCRDSGGAGAGSAGAPGVRRGKQRNASDPNRLTAAAHHSDAEILPGANDPSVSSSSSSLSTRSNDSNTNVDTNNQAQSQSSSSDEEEMLGEQWISSVSPEIVESLSSRHRKRQEVIHELITSERSHIRWLRVLHALYLRPLERAPPPPAPRLLPLDEVRALMPNLPGVRERHARLYADLRALRTREGIVPVRGVADAVLNTLGAPDYVVTVSVFCRGQRRALEALRERRRKAKELHAFLARAEQAPKCGRLQLRDLLACVWQRLTKYQLLLESILKTITEEDAENEEDVDRLRLALATAKEVLQGVDAAIRRDENEHRLRTIQSKMEVRPGVVGGAGGTAGGAGSSGSLVAACTADVEEMKRLDLTAHNLLLEGELTVRQDTNKKTILLALLLEDCLVLLHRDGDKFVLKQINQPSQQTLLSPIVRWSTVLFRPNAAVKNGFFLVNVNGIQMYELSTNTHTEYNTWSKHISEVPLALSNRPRNTQPSHAHNAEASISRNPSNASAKSESSLPETETETSTAGSEEAPTELNTSAQTHTDSLNIPLEPHDKEPEQQEQHEQGGVSTNGRVVQHPSECPAPLELPEAVTVKAPPITQQAVLTTTVEGRLRRLDKTISAAMQAKAALVSQTLGMSSHKAGDQPYADMKPAELEKMLECIDSHGAEPQPERNDFDSCMDSSGLSDEDEGPSLLQLTGRDRTVHQLLLAAQAQANLLQETLNRTFELTSFDCHNLKGWQREGLCDTCVEQPLYSNTEPVTSGNTNFVSGINAQDMRCGVGIEKEISFDMLSELDRSCEELEGDCEEVERRRQTLAEQRLGNVILMEHIGESSTDPPPALAAPPIGCPPLPTESAHSLARALAPASCALGSALSALASALPAAARERTRLRRALRQANERYQRLAHRHRDCHTHGAAPVDSGGANLDQNLQDQPNGGG